MITLFEKFVNKSRYEVLAVKVDTIDNGRKIQSLCFDNDIFWNGGSKSYYDAGGYIYINLLEGVMMRSSELDLLYLTNYKWDRKEYTIGDLYKIERILKYGDKPNYAPKKFNRTFESVTNYPYRFKTEEEMLKEFGEDWRYTAFLGLGWNSLMFSFCGEDYPYTEEEVNLDFVHPDWHVNMPRADAYKRCYIPWTFLTKNKPTKPNYKPKKFNRSILEKVDDIIDEIIVAVNNEDEVQILKNTLREKITIKDFRNVMYPNWYFITFKDGNKKAIIWDDKNPKEEEMLKSINSDDRTYKKIFTIKDIRIISKIIETGEMIKEPNYKPKKFNRF